MHNCADDVLAYHNDKVTLGNDEAQRECAIAATRTATGSRTA